MNIIKIIGEEYEKYKDLNKNKKIEDFTTNKFEFDPNYFIKKHAKKEQNKNLFPFIKNEELRFFISSRKIFGDEYEKIDSTDSNNTYNINLLDTIRRKKSIVDKLLKKPKDENHIFNSKDNQLNELNNKNDHQNNNAIDHEKKNKNQIETQTQTINKNNNNLFDNITNQVINYIDKNVKDINNISENDINNMYKIISSCSNYCQFIDLKSTLDVIIKNYSVLKNSKHNEKSKNNNNRHLSINSDKQKNDLKKILSVVKTKVHRGSCTLPRYHNGDKIDDPSSFFKRDSKENNHLIGEFEKIIPVKTSSIEGNVTKQNKKRREEKKMRILKRKEKNERRKQKKATTIKIKKYIKENEEIFNEKDNNNNEKCNNYYSDIEKYEKEISDNKNNNENINNKNDENINEDVNSNSENEIDTSPRRKNNKKKSTKKRTLTKKTSIVRNPNKLPTKNKTTNEKIQNADNDQENLTSKENKSKEKKKSKKKKTKPKSILKNKNSENISQNSSEMDDDDYVNPDIKNYGTVKKKKKNISSLFIELRSKNPLEKKLDNNENDDKNIKDFKKIKRGSGSISIFVEGEKENNIKISANTITESEKDPQQMLENFFNEDDDGLEELNELKNLMNYEWLKGTSEYKKKLYNNLIHFYEDKDENNNTNSININDINDINDYNDFNDINDSNDNDSDLIDISILKNKRRESIEINEKMQKIYEDIEFKRKAKKEKNKKFLKNPMFGFLGVNLDDINEVEKKKKFYLLRLREDIRYKIKQKKLFLYEMDNFNVFEKTMNRVKVQHFAGDPEKIRRYVKLLQKYFQLYQIQLVLSENKKSEEDRINKFLYGLNYELDVMLPYAKNEKGRHCKAKNYNEDNLKFLYM